MTNPYQAPSADTGDSVSQALAPCRGCGHSVHVQAAICPKCGLPQRKRRYKSKYAAAILALFLGGFGAHRFYLGQWWGIFYLVLFWTGIPWLVGLIEFIVMLLTTDTTWNRRHNEGKPAGPSDKSSGVVIVIAVVVGFFFMIAIVGILAAIAIPAYHDYTVRAKIAATFSEVKPVQTEYSKFYQQHGLLPDSNIMIGLDDPLITPSQARIQVNEQGIEVLFANKAIEGKTILFVLSEEDVGLVWDCRGGSLDKKYRPANCR
ncbi:NINE protein [Pleionea sp. CnH1-48]|uniref:NINE protein n=1 Tax=Pleionea sp. CnH1-48 TaxID=2954494 RepID=UPI00209742D5|nr:NINE protein [Pleionea sp. CnH1-48]MCO7226045.1 NINE protein [Pleionea sp. CnH1-48]